MTQTGTEKGDTKRLPVYHHAKVKVYRDLLCKSKNALTLYV